MAPDDIESRYKSLDAFNSVQVETAEAIRPECLIAFPYERADHPAEVFIETDEFSAVCPWTGQPDLGTIRLRYLPGEKLLELKSFKYYLLTYRNVGIVQEHVANRLLDDLARAIEPRELSIEVDYKPRGGIHTLVKVSL